MSNNIVRTYQKYKGNIMVIKNDDLDLFPDELIKDVTSDIIPEVYPYYKRLQHMVEYLINIVIHI